MKYLILFLVGFSFVSCSSEEETDNPVITEKADKSNPNTIEELMIRHIEAKLKLNALDKYEYKIYKEELNRDDSTDWIITVNLYDRAINEALDSKRSAKMAEIGYVGHYNYFFFMDGATKTFSPEIVAPSSAYGKLDVSFENITSVTNKDFTVDLRFKNSRRRLFYKIINSTPRQIGEEVIYSDYGKEDGTVESYVIEFEQIENSGVHNIAVYEGDLKQKTFTDSLEIYSSQPEINSTGNLVRRWYYSPKFAKYYMKKDEI